MCFVILFLHEYIVVVRKVAFTNIIKLYPYFLPDNDPIYRKKKIAISQLTPSEKQNYRVVINGMEGEVSKHTNSCRTMSWVLEEEKSFGIIGHLNTGVELCRKIAGLDKFVLGEVTINGFEMRTRRADAQKNLSLSIQSEKICCSMSAYEYLEVLCYCRGVKYQQINPMLLEIFDMLLMGKVMYNPISSFDQCYIKKLSFASALVGKISVMIIDQPTACIDPISKIAIWNAIQFARSIGKTIIFSSDSMSEADSLSDQIMFLLEGSIVGLDSPTDIRIKVCKGFYIELRMASEGKSPTEIEEKYMKFTFQSYLFLIEFVSSSLQSNLSFVRQFFQYMSNTSVELKSMSKGVYMFHVPIRNMDWVKVITIIENNKARLGIFDYLLESRAIYDIMYKSFE